jgi:hypothetical protein
MAMLTARLAAATLFPSPITLLVTTMQVRDLVCHASFFERPLSPHLLTTARHDTESTHCVILGQRTRRRPVAEGAA